MLAIIPQQQEASDGEKATQILAIEDKKPQIEEGQIQQVEKEKPAADSIVLAETKSKKEEDENLEGKNESAAREASLENVAIKAVEENGSKVADESGKKTEEGKSKKKKSDGAVKEGKKAKGSQKLKTKRNKI